MKGDWVVVTKGIYACEFGEINEVDTMTQIVAFFSFSQQKTMTVPIRSTAFTPNPTALQYTHERGYDVVAGDVIQVVRGDRLSVLGTVLQVDLGEKTLTFKDTLHTEVSFRQSHPCMQFNVMIIVHYLYCLCCENWRAWGS